VLTGGQRPNIFGPCSRTSEIGLPFHGVLGSRRSSCASAAGSGAPQLVQEGARSPEALGEHRRVLPYAYAQVVLEAEG
jgi:hypothetical protein